MKRAIVVTGLVGLAAGAALGQVAPQAEGQVPVRGELQRLANGIEIAPVRIAPVVRGPDGLRQIGDWVPYGEPMSRACDELEMKFDCVALTGDCPDGYFFFGTAFCDTFVTNDMVVAGDTDPDAGFRRLDFAWYWTCAGFGTEKCLVAVFTQDSEPCDPDSFDYSGWLLDFGALSCNPGGYYITNVDLSTAGTWPVPDAGEGSYAVFYAKEVTSSGALVLATCAQPMLWATGEDRGDPSAPGTQGPEQFGGTDQTHDPEDCGDLTFGDCPTELGAVAGFWQEVCDGCGYADFNGDGSVNTLDFSAFLNAWVPGAESANCNGDSTVNSLDFLCFLNIWNECR